MSNIVSSRKTGGFLSKFRSRKHKSESPDPGSANEENVGMHPLTVSPGFSPTKRSQKRTTVDALQVTALHARGLVSADSNGFSDPFVEVKVPGSRRGEKFKVVGTICTLHFAMPGADVNHSHFSILCDSHV